MGRLKYPSSANPSDEDACALWLHRSTILGSAALGEAADAMVGLCFVCIYRILTREYLSHLIFILIPLWRGFYFSEDILSDIHTKHVSYRRTESRWMACTTRYLSHRHMILLCVAKKGDFTSEASPLCLGRAHKSLRTVGHSPREGGRARLIYLTINALHAVLGQKMRRERVFLL